MLLKLILPKCWRHSEGKNNERGLFSQSSVIANGGNLTFFWWGFLLEGEGPAGKIQWG